MVVIRDKEVGNVITEVSSVREGELLIRQYEADDVIERCYTPDFYEVVVTED